MLIPRTVKHVLQVIAAAVAMAAFTAGLWGRLHYEAVQHQATTGITWVTIPTARFMLWLTNRGEIIPLVIIAALIGAVYYYVVLLATASMLRRVALAQQAKSKDN